MGRNLLAIGIFVLSLLIASASAAEELIQNGGFESGELLPWEEAASSGAWSVTDGYAFQGSYSALVRGTYELGQSFDPCPGADIEVFSIAVMTGMPGWITVKVVYDDALDPVLVQLYVPAALQWQTFDLLDYIDPARDVSGVVLSGHQNGDSPDDMRTWYDEITLQNSATDDPVEEPEETEALQAETQRVEVKFNTKRPKTHLSLALRAEDLPEGIHEGPVEIRVLFSQDGLTTAFEAEAELVEVRCPKGHCHSKDHSIRLLDSASARKLKCRH